jgi:hypothetical protein
MFISALLSCNSRFFFFAGRDLGRAQGQQISFNSTWSDSDVLAVKSSFCVNRVSVYGESGWVAILEASAFEFRLRESSSGGDSHLRSGPTALGEREGDRTVLLYEGSAKAMKW